ncbi:CRISPR-associated helicase Cas3/CRISPR-associated endonuclease Cas3-HD [Actinopolyspora biskrensis]|uniref:CRISPR-associated helicase Cas3/CRISPR-associated endonuclease Cas3-HD n=1 Tax=Actinopolyspora biskrensis TaxID=1470178 RepID=A0A852YWM0_9ACTN|nr:CRISPR-associated helicase Cas3' [Actinopolyspora biskrensis]NYH79031.1 CRISPR-associated helicase Cas3/CRISPR-associated endonuclease Cas3-HD [Actinopolyspora biskrensis]
MEELELSRSARAVWAKSTNGEGDWLPLWRHMDDAADVAAWLFDHWLASSVVRLLAAEFGGDVVAARCAVMFLAGAHDVGKATPAFAVQDTGLAQRMRELGLYMPTEKRDLPDRNLAHHTVTGHHLLIGWLVDKGWRKSSARTWGIVLGSHHGVPLDSDSENTPTFFPCLYGTGTWETVQRELLERVAVRSGAAERLDQWRELKLSAAFQVLVTGLVIVSDWIASNEDLLPFLSGELPEVHEEPRRVSRALEELRLPGAWRPSGGPDSVAELFRTRFQLPDDAQPRPVQHAACELARTASEPGLIIVEAPMGEGKTEAALAASEIMAARWGLGGLLVALPTQATSDAMFDRVVDWLDAMGAEDQQVGGAVTLSHGKARFNRLFQGLVRQGRRPSQVGSDEERHRTSHAVVAHSWLSGRKKSQLANFMVGTIDQLLFAGLKSRHLMLRHLGLAGKVVVLDEVHAYDVYMNSYLTKVLTWLGAYRVPVLALSATLPADRRRALLEAYQQGREYGSGGASGQEPAAIPDEVDGDPGYPLLSWSDGNRVDTKHVGPSGRRTEVALDSLGGGVDEDLDALVSLLRDSLSDGGCAVVVRNTVGRVLETARRLEREFPGEITVAHSRFITADRMRKDSELLDRFGAPDRAVRRPQRHIVVASQVIEQSLDVDFDLLVTDLAPVDLVLQRMGRLHRHQRGVEQRDRPAKLRSARAYLAGVDLTQGPPALEEAAARHIYGTYWLLRSAAVLQPRLGGEVVLPEDIATLVQRAYGPDQVEPADWQEVVSDAWKKWQESSEERECRARDFQVAAPTKPGKAIIGWISANVGEADDGSQGQGQVRDGAPSLEVILLQHDETGNWFTPEWLSQGTGKLPVPREETPADDLAQVMASCSLRLPLAFSNAEAEEELWQATPVAWEDSPLIYRLPVLLVDQHGWARIADRQIRYTPDTGLEVYDSAN